MKKRMIPCLSAVLSLVFVFSMALNRSVYANEGMTESSPLVKKQRFWMRQIQKNL